MTTALINAKEARALESTVYGDLDIKGPTGEKKTILEDLKKRGLVHVIQGPKFWWDDTNCYEITSKGRLELNIFEKNNPGWRFTTPMLS